MEFDREEILGILRQNRGNHRRVFEDALENYRARLLRDLQDHVTELQRGRAPEVRIRLARPEDHTPDYDRMIKMVEMHQGDRIPMTEDRFAQLVMDDWSWKRQWLTTANTYAAGTVAEVYGSNGDF